MVVAIFGCMYILSACRYYHSFFFRYPQICITVMLLVNLMSFQLCLMLHLTRDDEICLCVCQCKKSS